MSLDVDLMVTQPTSVYSGNITHNLGKMASEVKVGIGAKIDLYTISVSYTHLTLPTIYSV